MTTKMTREQAISNYVSQLNSEDLVMLINHMNSYDGCFEDQQWYDMDEFNEFLSNHTPYEIAQMIFTATTSTLIMTFSDSTPTAT